jgi:hypothetical protein
MWRTILRWAAALLAALTLCLPISFAQQRKDYTMTYSNTGEPEEGSKHGTPALQYAIAVLAVILVLVILCMPSRKRIMD